MSAPDVVVVTFPAFDLGNPNHAGRLLEAGLDVRLAPKTGARSASDVARLIADAAAAIVSTDPFDGSVFSACPKLRVLARVGVGVDSIDLEAASASGVVVTVTPGANDEVVADHTLALMLAALRGLVDADASVKRGEWNRGADKIGAELHGSTVGILGLGSIGQAVARRLQGFDCNVLAFDVELRRVPGVELVSFENLLERAEILTIHVPLLDSTRNLIGAPELARLRPGAILVNAARGGIVDEQALFDALRAGRLRAAALDVFEAEPPVGSPLLRLPNVVVSPHVASFGDRSIARMLSLAAESVVEVLAGREPPCVVNPLGQQAG